MSSQPSMSGIRKFPKAARSTGIATQKIMMRAVHRDERVVLPGRHPPKERHRFTGKGQLHPEHVDGEAADERHEYPGEQVLHGDDLVVRRPQVLLEEA